MFRRLCHWGPLIALSIIFSLFISTIYCSLIYAQGPLTFLIICVNLLLILYNFLTVCARGAGHVPLKWQPSVVENTRFLQYCDVCKGYKAPRAHHCSKCNRCCMKMDHHCPWINNCVGHRNHAAFVRFLFHVIVGCSHASYIQIFSLYRMLFGGRYWALRRSMRISAMAVTANVLAVGLCIGVTVAVGLLLVHQLLNIKRNQTDIEGWIMRKARTTREKGNTLKFPYDLGWKRNFKSVLWTQHEDGITWEVCDGCHQYTLTMEQIEQKKRKRDETYSFDVTSGYLGNCNYFGIGFGCRVMWSCPTVDESRLRVKRGDRVMVTRIRQHWLYGNKVLSHLVANGIGDVSQPNTYSKERGWFPRICAVPSNKKA